MNLFWRLIGSKEKGPVGMLNGITKSAPSTPSLEPAQVLPGQCAVNVLRLREELNRFYGIVDRFFEDRGYGFVHSPIGTVYIRAERVVNGARLKEGDLVEFKAMVVTKGLAAAWVKLHDRTAT